MGSAEEFSVSLRAQSLRNCLASIGMMGVAAAFCSAGADEPVRHTRGARNIQLGPQLQGAEFAQPRALTIRRPPATYLCPDPRDPAQRCPQLRPSQTIILLGPGAPVAPMGSGLLGPPRVPEVDYSQPPAPGLYAIASALDRPSVLLPPLRMSLIILMQTRPANAPLPFQILPSLHR